MQQAFDKQVLSEKSALMWVSGYRLSAAGHRLLIDSWVVLNDAISDVYICEVSLNVQIIKLAYSNLF